MPKWGEPVSRELLEALYYERSLSAQEIADDLGISYHKVAYWMDQYGLKRRDRSEASYLKHNPNGEKFHIDLSDRDLFIAGVTLYLGEGGKTRSSELILVNSDPGILNLWGRFLERVCNVPPEKLRAHIQYYDDLDYPTLLDFWANELGIPPENFGQPTVKQGRAAKGDYQGRRIPYGTVHVRFNDSILKSLMMSWMKDLVEGNL
jgi:hypothetical protein